MSMPYRTLIFLMSMVVVSCWRSTETASDASEDPPDASNDTIDGGNSAETQFDCPSEGVVFPDPIVEQEVRERARVPTGPLTPENVRYITRLNVRGASSLEGLQCLSELRVLVATDGSIDDLRPLAARKTRATDPDPPQDPSSPPLPPEVLDRGLHLVDVSNNDIRDVPPLSEFTSTGQATFFFYAENNRIHDLDWVKDGRTGCGGLWLQGNPIATEEAQQKRICDEGLRMVWGGMNDEPISSCNLRYDSCEHPIVDSYDGAPPPDGCEGEIVFSDRIVNSKIRAYTGIPNEPLTYADVAPIHALRADGSESLEGVQCLTNLQELRAEFGFIEDLAPLAPLTELRSVYLLANSVRDFAPLLNGKEHLFDIFLVNNRIDVIPPITSGFPEAPSNRCQSIHLGGNPIDISGTPEELAKAQQLCDLGWHVGWGAPSGESGPNYECRGGINCHTVFLL